MAKDIRTYLDYRETYADSIDGKDNNLRIKAKAALRGIEKVIRSTELYHHVYSIDEVSW